MFFEIGVLKIWSFALEFLFNKTDHDLGQSIIAQGLISKLE